MVRFAESLLPPAPRAQGSRQAAGGSSAAARGAAADSRCASADTADAPGAPHGVPAAAEHAPRSASGDECRTPAAGIETFVEFAHSGGLQPRVDRQAGVIAGVKVLGLASRNGRRYRKECIDGAVPLYEGAKVNVDHPRGDPAAPRDYRDRLGLLRNVRSCDDGLYADLHFNPKHPLAEQLAWDAQHAPYNVGLSHNVQARTSRQGNDTVVEQIVYVHSVDLVADPATTCGLFEGQSAWAGCVAGSAPHVALDPGSASRPAAHRLAELVRHLPAAVSCGAGLSATLCEALAALIHVDAALALRLLEEHLRLRAAIGAVPGTPPRSKGPFPEIDRDFDVARWARAVT
jgi:hypothetical protein